MEHLLLSKNVLSRCDSWNLNKLRDSMVYSPEMVALLQQLRSRIFAEFGTRIRLVDPEVLTTLASLGKKSRDPFTRKTVVEIMKLAGLPFELEASVKPSSPGLAKDEHQIEIMYRGSKILRNKALNYAAAGDDVAAAPTGQRQTKQMYRGQVVYK
jgi:hypothetical protein